VLSLSFVPLPNSSVSAQGVSTNGECGVASGLSLPKSCPEYNCSGKSSQECLTQNPITQWTVLFINVLGVIIIVGASAMLVYAGVEYIAAADNPDRVKKAKQKIINVIIGVIAFFFMYAFLQWLIPGGAF
jgi:hypothetical protein